MIDDYKMGICSQYTFNLSLFIYYCGSKVCKEESWNPQYTDNYMLFYVFKGQGRVVINEKDFEVESCHGFLVPPKTKVTFYSAGEPCEIAWIGFYGFLAHIYLDRAGLTLDHPIFEDDLEQGIGKIFIDILKNSNLKHNRYCRITASLYMIFSRLLDIYDTRTHRMNANDLMENYLTKALQFIDMNYAENITIAQIASFVGIDRKYLHFIFKKKLDIGPQQYLITFRMHKASVFLQDNNLSIAEISKIIGYDNPLNFSKMFKKIIGVSPIEYKKNPTFVKYNVINWKNRMRNC